MAIEPLNISGAPKTGFASNPLKKSDEQPSLAEILNGGKDGIEEKEKLKKSEKDEKDKVSLSERAIQAYAEEQFKKYQTNETREVNEEQFAQKLEKVKELSVDFIGVERLQADPANTEKLEKIIEKKSEILGALENLGVSENDARKIGKSVLAKSAKEVESINQIIDSGDVTAKDVKRLAEINRTLNRANGIGLLDDSTSVGDKRKVEELSTTLDVSLQSNDERRLRQEEVNNLLALQQQISEISGYRLNARDSVGSQGVLA